MKMIFKIAKAELRHLFYSPIAWSLIIVFYILCAYQFLNPLVDLSRIQEARLETDPNYEFNKPISIVIFIGSIHNVLNTLYLFIPLLTMGIINREIASGSIKLLYSSPIRTRDLVLGKYIGLMAFNVVLIFIVFLLFATGYCTIIHAEYKQYMGIVLAFFLMVNAYVAIGMFMSALTSYQLVAAITTFVVFFLLQLVGDFWQDDDFFRDLSYFLTMTNKAEIMVNGMITTRDVLYFILITAMFLAFTLIKLKSTQESKPWKVLFLRYGGAFIIIMVLGYYSSRPGYVGYFDVTNDQSNTLHPNVQSMFKKLDGSPLTVTLYTNLLGRSAALGLPRSRNKYIWDYWETFVRYYPNIQLKYVEFYDVNENNRQIVDQIPDKSVDQVALMVATLQKVDITKFRKPEDVRQLIDLSQEDYGLILEFEYKGKKVLSRTYPDDMVVPSQSNIAATIQRLIEPSVPQIVLPTGHYERSPNSLGERGYGKLLNSKTEREALINAAVDIDTVSLLENDIPSNTDILFIADPKSDYNSDEKDKMLAYLRNGGNAYIIGEPGKQHILNEILAEIGVAIESGIIVERKRDQTPDDVLLLLTKAGTRLADENLMVGARNDKGVAGATGFFTVSAASLDYKEKDGFKIEPIYEVYSQKEVWVETGHYVADSAAPVYAPVEGDFKKDKYVVALKLTRTINNKEQRIVISGDADNLSNFRHGGIPLSRGILSWLMYNEYPVYANYPAPKDVNVTIGFDTARALYIIYLYVIPSLLLLSGVIILIRRSRQ